MKDTSSKPAMESKDNCGICGSPLVYGTAETPRQCVYCGKEYPALIYCPQGHYVCDSCHGAEALGTLRQVLASSTSTCPVDIMELVMSHSSVPMHGPEHHSIVPAAIVAAARNAGYPVPEGALDNAITRGSKVPGGWCGSHGACGAGIGVGIAVSVLTEATPLTGRQRALANEATSYTLSRLLDGHPRCCKRAGRRALEAAAKFLRDKMNIDLEMKETTGCNYTERNKECVKEECPYF
ncbi:DUF5714 domain-containing protein [Chloroflexota bacterium]